MHAIKTGKTMGRLLHCAAFGLAALSSAAAHAAAPGISGPTFNLDATDAYITQPDGASIYTWGYGCTTGSTPTFLPAPSGSGIASANNCSTMQVPGPTLIVHEGDSVTVNLTNNLPGAAGNTSILFPGFDVTVSGGSTGLLTGEAATGKTVTYTFTASSVGTHSYYSGTQGDLQVEMGLYGAVIVLPATVPTVCTNGGNGTQNDKARAVTKMNGSPDQDFRLSPAAYNNPAACYDREYLFQFAEMDPRIHTQADAQKAVPCTMSTGCMTVETEPYHPAYFLINGRSMPDDMDPNYAPQYPHQPYNGNPHMHPGELTLIRVIGQGRMQHPFHEHANHLRMLAHDGNLMLARDKTNPMQVENNDPTTAHAAGPLLFTTTTTPGQAMDAIFQYTGRGLNWDVYAHGEPGDTSVCVPDANGYFTSDPTAPNYYEWCADHKKPLEAHPFGNVGGGGPVTLPQPQLFRDGPWYSGSPYLGPEATARGVGTTPLAPAGTVINSPSTEAGFAYMWHSHNEREITTDNIFPGGMLMMMLVDPWVVQIDESN